MKKVSASVNTCIGTVSQYFKDDYSNSKLEGFKTDSWNQNTSH